MSVDPEVIDLYRAARRLLDDRVRELGVVVVLLGFGAEFQAIMAALDYLQDRGELL